MGQVQNNRHEKFEVGCMGCGVSKDLKMYAHRHATGTVAGFIYVCDLCAPTIVGQDIIVSAPTIPDSLSPRVDSMKVTYKRKK